MKAKASKGWRLDTSCVHAGEGVDSDTRAIRRPIHMANSYELPTDVDQLLEVFSWDHLDKFQYTREHSATPRHLEERLAALEGSEDCVVTASGMGAVSAALFPLLGAGDHLVAPEICYTGTQKLVSFHLPRFGVDVSVVDTADPKEVEDAIRPDTKVVYLETPGNPLVSITDIRKLSELAHGVGATVIVDSTWSGLVNQSPSQVPRRSARTGGRSPGGLHQPLQRLADHARDRHLAHASREALAKRPRGRPVPGVARAGDPGEVPGAPEPSSA
jgi:cystathionine beta-lyase/cystathionine gamma-synthase